MVSPSCAYFYAGVVSVASLHDTAAVGPVPPLVIGKHVVGVKTDTTVEIVNLPRREMKQLGVSDASVCLAERSLARPWTTSRISTERIKHHAQCCYDSHQTGFVIYLCVTGLMLIVLAIFVFLSLVYLSFWHGVIWILYSSPINFDSFDAFVETYKRDDQSLVDF